MIMGKKKIIKNCIEVQWKVCSALSPNMKLENNLGVCLPLHFPFRDYQLRQKIMKVMRVMKVMKVMANGTSLPFNWSPNSGQYVVEASRGPLQCTGRHFYYFRDTSWKYVKSFERMNCLFSPTFCTFSTQLVPPYFQLVINCIQWIE